MDTRKIAVEYRLTCWAKVMRECRESGLSNKAYCRQVGLQEGAFYYWQHKLREAACEQLLDAQPGEKQEELAVRNFTEVQVVEQDLPSTEEQTGRLQIELGRLRLTADSSYPQKELACLLRELIGPC